MIVRISSILVVINIILISCAGVKPPTLKSDIEPEYPINAQAEGLRGTVNMLIFVSSDGNVDDVVIRKSSGYSILDTAAIEYAHHLEFNPAKKVGFPIETWITWSVTYKPRPLFFIPEKYVEEIHQFYEKLSNSPAEEKRKIIQQILYAHEEYVIYSSRNPLSNYNSSIRKVLLDITEKKWKDIWDLIPLRFPVFQDFLIRYPDSEWQPYALNKFFDYVEADIDRIEIYGERNIISHENEQKILTIIYRYLNSNYNYTMPGWIE